ncbi:MAG: response regulator [Janthinobacterium lividum]
MQASQNNLVPSTAGSRQPPKGRARVSGRPQAGATPLAKPYDARDAHSIRILIIEDDAVIASLLAEVLTGLGYDVCATAATESAAVVAAARFAPNLMIVDVELETGSGISAVATIQQEASVPYFFMTAGATQLVSDGAVVLQKPFREADIVHAIDRTVGFSTQHRS